MGVGVPLFALLPATALISFGDDIALELLSLFAIDADADLGLVADGDVASLFILFELIDVSALSWLGEGLVGRLGESSVAVTMVSW